MNDKDHLVGQLTRSTVAHSFCLWWPPLLWCRWQCYCGWWCGRWWYWKWSLQNLCQLLIWGILYDSSYKECKTGINEMEKRQQKKYKMFRTLWTRPRFCWKVTGRLLVTGFSVIFCTSRAQRILMQFWNWWTGCQTKTSYNRVTKKTYITGSPKNINVYITGWPTIKIYNRVAKLHKIKNILNDACRSMGKVIIHNVYL